MKLTSKDAEKTIEILESTYKAAVRKNKEYARVRESQRIQVPESYGIRIFTAGELAVIEEEKAKVLQKIIQTLMKDFLVVHGQGMTSQTTAAKKATSPVPSPSDQPA